MDVAPARCPDAVRLTYLGVGGWIMQRGGDQLLAAPLFTNPSFVRTGLAVHPLGHRGGGSVDGPYDVSDARAPSWWATRHYDHLMDVPRVARRHAPGRSSWGAAPFGTLLGTW